MFASVHPPLLQKKTYIVSKVSHYKHHDDLYGLLRAIRGRVGTMKITWNNENMKGMMRHRVGVMKFPWNCNNESRNMKYVSF